jgi:DNA-binding ferritin-like protein (Dps family)
MKSKPMSFKEMESQIAELGFSARQAEFLRYLLALLEEKYQTVLDAIQQEVWHDHMEKIANFIATVQCTQESRDKALAAHQAVYEMIEKYVIDVDATGQDDTRFCPGGPRMVPTP